MKISEILSSPIITKREKEHINIFIVSYELGLLTQKEFNENYNWLKALNNRIKGN